MSPRKVQSTAIVTNAGVIKGTFLISPADEKANSVQANINIATIIVPIGARKVPCCAESIIGSRIVRKISSLFMLDST